MARTLVKSWTSEIVNPTLAIDTKKHNSFVFIGKVLPPGDDSTDEYHLDINDFSKKQTEAIDLVGLPLYYNHFPKLPLGSIIDSFYENEERYVIGIIEMKNNRFARHVVDEIAAGNMLGLSLNHYCFTFLEQKTDVKLPVEVSNVYTNETGRPNTHILFGKTFSKANPTLGPQPSDSQPSDSPAADSQPADSQPAEESSDPQPSDSQARSETISGDGMELETPPTEIERSGARLELGIPPEEIERSEEASQKDLGEVEKRYIYFYDRYHFFKSTDNFQSRLKFLRFLSSPLSQFIPRNMQTPPTDQQQTPPQQQQVPPQQTPPQTQTQQPPAQQQQQQVKSEPLIYQGNEVLPEDFEALDAKDARKLAQEMMRMNAKLQQEAKAIEDAHKKASTELAELKQNHVKAFGDAITNWVEGLGDDVGEAYKNDIRSMFPIDPADLNLSQLTNAQRAIVSVGANNINAHKKNREQAEEIKALKAELETYTGKRVRKSPFAEALESATSSEVPTMSAPKETMEAKSLLDRVLKNGRLRACNN